MGQLGDQWNALQLLQALRARGFTAEVHGDRLFVAPGDQLTEADCEAIRRAKPELMALVRDEAICERLLARLPPGGYGRAVFLCDWEG